MAAHAPGSLGLVQDFVNTLEYERDQDIEQIGTPEALTAWLEERGLLSGGPAAASDVARTAELREAIRGLLFANNGGPAAEADLALLNRVAGESGLRPRFTPEGRVVLEPAAGGLRGALGRLVAAVSEAMSEGSWHRLKACADDGCRWAFYDSSRNRSGHWCSMESCGNRSKARQFRRRRRSDSMAQGRRRGA
ncbi:MAG TPA: ABATE domain-containing protein [Candidatus Dormibacteraeota bacterium]|nr:ABATE domain-containing protein [Candidatus Dormibacteraeota bacterium]